MAGQASGKKVEWERTLLAPTATIQQAIERLDQSALQIVLVVKPDGMLVGTITDGDIRRGLLKGLTLDTSIEAIVRSNPVVVPPDWSRDLVLQLMQANKIHQLPVVNEKGLVVGLHVWDALLAPNERRNIMVIMAGGKGTRLRPETENCPKPLLPVHGRPILEFILERAKVEGFRRIFLAINYLGHMIEDRFGDGHALGIEIEYLREDMPLGTAGALGLLNVLPEEPILVTNGDVLTDVRYGEMLDFHCYHQAAATMAVRQYEWQNPFGVVRSQGVDIVEFEEKPITRSHINAGIYALEPRAISLIGKDEFCDMPTLFGRLQDNSERTIVFPVHEPWLDVGRPGDLEQARGHHAAQPSFPAYVAVKPK